MTLPLLDFFFLSTPTQSAPIIVKLVEPKTAPTGMADILIGALGLTGALTILAVVLGVVIAGVLFLARSRHPLR